MLFKIAFWEEGGYGNHCTVVPVTCLPPIFQIQERVRNNHSNYVPVVRDGSWEWLDSRSGAQRAPIPFGGLVSRGGIPVIVLIAGRLKTVASKPCLAVAVWTQVFVNSASDLGGRLD